MSHSSSPGAPPQREMIAYQPLSGLAVVSLALSGLFAVVLVAGAFVGLVKGAPVFWPTWFLLVPVAGAVLGLLAHWRIRRAEGTQAGVALARWGCWLGLLATLGYGAYYFATGLAVQQQANKFLLYEGEDTGFFPRLLKGDVNRAFLLTLPYSRRGSTNPDDSRQMEIEFDRQVDKESGPLSHFRNSQIVHLVRAASKEGQTVEPLGVRSWVYEKQGYRVERTYRIVTQEGQFDVLVPVVAEQDPTGGDRKWQVDIDGIAPLPSTHLTPLGEGLKRLRMSAAFFLKQLTQGMTFGQRGGAAEQGAPVPKDETAWEDLWILGKGRAGSGRELVPQIRKETTALFQGPGLEGQSFRVPEQPMCPWREVDGRVQLTLAFRMPLFETKATGRPEFVGDGTLILQTRDRIDPLHVMTEMPAWQITAFRLDRVMPAPTRGPRQK